MRTDSTVLTAPAMWASCSGTPRTGSPPAHLGCPRTQRQWRGSGQRLESLGGLPRTHSRASTHAFCSGQANLVGRR
eukprot:9763181-Alexandrium_andersonii.AAC.1